MSRPLRVVGRGSYPPPPKVQGAAPLAPAAPAARTARRWCVLAPLLAGLAGCGAESTEGGGGEAAGVELAREVASVTTTITTATTNYLNQVLDETAVHAFFGVGASQAITQPIVASLLTGMGITASDAQLTMTPKVVPTVERKSGLAAEYLKYSVYYFGQQLGTQAQVQQRLTAQGGLTARQYLPYARIGFGAGPCSTRVGTSTCPVTVSDLQTSLLKGLDMIWNLRYPSSGDNKWNNTFALHREDLAYRLVFDAIARSFGHQAHNPLRDLALDTSDPASKDCALLTSMLANGRTFESFLRTRTGMPGSLSHATGRFLDGVTEAAVNTYTGKLTTYRYGLFNFLGGLNCSRLDPHDTCYVGEPLLPPYLLAARGVTPSREDGQYSWTCSQIAGLIDTLVSNPYASPYEVLRTPTDFQFDPARYPLAGKPTALTAEDVLMFYVAIANAHVNQPGAPFADNLPVADLDALAAEGVMNPEFEFQYYTFTMVFSYFLR